MSFELKIIVIATSTTAETCIFGHVRCDSLWPPVYCGTACAVKYVLGMQISVSSSTGSLLALALSYQVIDACS